MARKPVPGLVGNIWKEWKPGSAFDDEKN